jgi:beta-galactosidase/beta-glucuronidase
MQKYAEDFDGTKSAAITEGLGPTPRPEHPRPDQFRTQWLNLNGVWEFTFDVRDEGLNSGWCDGRPLDRQILVPFCPESKLSGIHDEELHTVCWYARSFDLPEMLRQKRLLLHFGAVDYRASVWLNGHFLGSHTGGYDPFAFDVTRCIRATGNRLVVRVHDDPLEAKPRGKQSPDRRPSGCRYMRVTGIWQTVWLEAVGDSYIRDWVATADPDTGTLSFQLKMDGPDLGLRLSAEVGKEGHRVAGSEARVASSAAALTVSVPNPAAWAPDHPTLYDVRLRLHAENGTLVDEVSTYVGFRTIAIHDGMIHLNGDPFFLVSALDQGYYHEGLYTPPTDDELRRDVERAKRYGLNHVRKHQIVAEPRFYYWCDRLGLTVWGEMADWGADPADEEQFLSQWRACLLRDINHPCIITWVPTNEWGPPDDPSKIQFKVNVYEATRNLDPARPVIDTSGYCHTRTDITDLHVNPPNGDACRDWWRQWQLAIAETGNFPLYTDRPVYSQGFRHQGQPVIFSETGNWRITECPPLGPWEPCGYGPVGTVREFIELYRDFFLALMSEPDCAGFSYVQLYDVEGEVNGYLTYDRKPKVPPEVIAEIHAEGLRLRASRGGPSLDRA